MPMEIIRINQKNGNSCKLGGYEHLNTATYGIICAKAWKAFLVIGDDPSLIGLENEPPTTQIDGDGAQMGEEVETQAGLIGG